MKTWGLRLAFEAVKETGEGGTRLERAFEELMAVLERSEVALTRKEMEERMEEKYSEGVLNRAFTLLAGREEVKVVTRGKWKTYQLRNGEGN